MVRMVKVVMRVVVEVEQVAPQLATTNARLPLAVALPNAAVATLAAMLAAAVATLEGAANMVVVAAPAGQVAPNQQKAVVAAPEQAPWAVPAVGRLLEVWPCSH